MVLEQGIPDFWAWLFGTEESSSALWHWLVATGIILGVSLAFSWLLAIIFRGPKRGTIFVFRRFVEGAADLFKISPRRVLSLTILCFREAIRRWAWVALVIYLILLAFAGFFLDPTTNDPAKLYMDFVMTSAAGLVAMIVLFLSVFSIPNDITRKTIYTVVTKPVHASEIILGRILGFSTVATLLLLGMGLASYLFVNRAIDHVHGFDPRQARWEYSDERHPVLVGQTEYESGHRHESRVLLKQQGGQWQRNVTEITHGHDHDVDTEFESMAVASYTETDVGYDLTIPGHNLVVNDKCLVSPAEQVTYANGAVDYAYDTAAMTVTAVSGDVVSVDVVEVPFSNKEKRGLSDVTLATENWMLHKVVLPLTSPQGLLTARVPVYASDFYFFDKAGQEKRAGVNVGNVWEYRSYVEGGSSRPLRSSVIWVFEGITAENYPIADYPTGLPLEFTLSIFRTHKGDIEKGVGGSLTVFNPETNRRSPEIVFEAKEFTINSQVLPRIVELSSGEGSLGLFEDLVYDGDKLMLELKCLDSGQYFGVARPDLYIAAADSSFALNYIKGFFSIYLQLLILTSFAVLFSTFLGGALSLIGSVVVCVAGIFFDWLTTVDLPGGLALESSYRMVTQAPITTPLEPGLITSGAQAADEVLGWGLKIINNVLPDLTKIWDIDYVANGFNVPGDVLAIQIATALGFFLPLFVLSHFILKCREVAK